MPLQPENHECFKRLVDQGWTDALRMGLVRMIAKHGNLWSVGEAALTNCGFMWTPNT